MENLKRYYLYKGGMYLDSHCQSSQHDQWMKFSDIKDILKTATNKQSVTALFDLIFQWAADRKIILGDDSIRDLAERLNA